MGDTTATIYVRDDDVDTLLQARGWRPCVQRDRRGLPFTSWTRPGHPSRAEGGRFGRDYLWHRQEALELALAGEAREEVSADG